MTAGTRALWPRIIRIPPRPYNESGTPVRTSYEYGDPVSVYRALVARNNVQFTIDESAQARVNVMTTPFIAFEGGMLDAFGADNRSGADPGRIVWHTEFDHTWFRPDYPAGLDIEVVGVVGDGDEGDLGLQVRVVPAGGPVDDQAAPYLISISASTTGPNSACAAAGLYKPSAPVSQTNIFRQVTIAEGSFARTPRVARMRIEVAMTVPPHDTGYMRSCYVREFPWRY